MNKLGKIGLVYAGGTIGMQPKNGELAPPENEKDFENACQIVIQEFQEKYELTVDFFYFDKKDSTERTPNDWVKFYTLLEKMNRKYLAVVVTH